MTEILEKIKPHFGTVDRPYYGPTYILPDGSLLNLDGRGYHSTVEHYLIENGLSNREYIKTGGSPTIEALGCIRCDMVKYCIGLSDEQPTREQYNSLLVWLDQHSKFTKIITVISPGGEQSTDYRFTSDFISDDVIDRIRRYYICGKLYEQLDTSVQFRRQNNFKYKREILGEVLTQADEENSQQENITVNYISKQTSYDLAYEISQKAKKVLGLSEYDRETLEHDINNLRAHEWMNLFNMIPDNNEVKKLYFTHCVKLEDENEQELDEDMESEETSKQDTTSKLTIDFILFTDLVFDTYQDNGDNYQTAIDRAQDIFPNIEFRKDDPDFEHITLYGDRRQIEKFLSFYEYGDNWKSRIKESYTDQELEEGTRNPYFTPYGYKDAMKVLNGKAPTYYYHLKEIEMDSGDGAKLANYAKKLGLNVIQDPDSDPDYPTWYIPGEYHWDDYFYPYPYAHECSISDKKEQELEEDMENNKKLVEFQDDEEDYKEDEDLDESLDKTYQITVKYHTEPNAKIEARSAKDRKDLEYQLNMDDEVEWYDFDESQFNEGYSKEGYSWDEVNGMIHIYENGKLIDKYPDMKSAEEAGWDLEGLVEDLDEECYNINEAVAPSSSFVELEGFKRDWRDLGLNDDDLRDLQNLIINNPSSSIPLGSNVYKIRFSPERLNRGKDTANRVIYIEVIKSNVIYLATAFSKSEEANISKAEEDILRAFAKILNK